MSDEILNVERVGKKKSEQIFRLCWLQKKKKWFYETKNSAIRIWTYGKLFRNYCVYSKLSQNTIGEKMDYIQIRNTRYMIQERKALFF